MAGPFFWAWVGGPPIPALDLQTSGDLWSGTWITVAEVWGGSLSTSGDILTGGFAVANLTSVAGLVAGTAYTVRGSGVPSVLGGAQADTTLTYDGAGGGTLSQRCTDGEGISLTLTNSAGTTMVFLDDVSTLVIGQTYGIAASGIPFGTTFVFVGGNAIAIDQPATATGLVSATVSSETGVGQITNLAHTDGLIEGLTYDVFGLGLPAGAQATYAGGATLTLLTRATRSAVAVPLFVSKGKTYPDGGPFDQSVHLVEDEQIFALELTQVEGGFPSLTLDVVNPRIGLLAAGRNLWGWLSWRNSAGQIVPLFHGRLVGTPENLQNEVVRLSFIARPNDFVAQKIAIADGMRELPYWDPVWLIDNIDDPDTVLETHTQLWHIDPTTLTVSASDIITGEDGLIDVAETEHFYDAMTVTFGAAPLRRVNVALAVNWTQSGSGDVDLTEAIVAAFRAGGSPYAWPKIASYTADDGLLNSWPLPKAGIGGGWSVGDGTVATRTLLTQSLVVTYTDRTDLSHVFTAGNEVDPPVTVIPGGGADTSTLVDMNWKPFFVGFNLSALAINFTAHFEASRKRSETIEFVVEADVQSILTDPLTAEEETVSLNSSFVDQGVDPGGAFPIGDLRRNTYFPTDRGQQSVQFGMLLARAKLLARARAVDISFTGTWDKLAGVASCRKSVLLHDGRLPGGQATGKVKSFKLLASDAGNSMHAEVTIGCTVGYGDPVGAFVGEDSYAVDYSDGYTETLGEEVTVLPGELAYQALDGAYVIDDDGVDLFNMTPDRVLKSLIVAGTPKEQEAAISASLNAPGNVAVETSIAAHGGAFLTNLAANSIAQVGNYSVNIQGGLAQGAGNPFQAPGHTGPEPFTVVGPSGATIGAGIRGAPFNAAGLSFNFPLGFPIADGLITINVTAEPAGTVGTVADPIGALGRTPTRIEVNLVPVTGGDFLSDFVLNVMRLSVPQTINLESPAAS